MHDIFQHLFVLGRPAGGKSEFIFHKVPDRDMLGFFRNNDWETMTGGAPDGRIEIGGVSVPFVSMLNEPESTDPLVLGDRYAQALGRLLDLEFTSVE